MRIILILGFGAPYIRELMVFPLQAVDQMSEDDGDCVLDAYLALGRFADTQYKQMDDYIASPTYKAKQELAAKARQEAEELRQVGEQNR